MQNRAIHAVSFRNNVQIMPKSVISSTISRPSEQIDKRRDGQTVIGIRSTADTRYHAIMLTAPQPEQLTSYRSIPQPPRCYQHTVSALPANRPPQSSDRPACTDLRTAAPVSRFFFHVSSFQHPKEKEPEQLQCPGSLSALLRILFFVFLFFCEFLFP